VEEEYMRRIAKHPILDFNNRKKIKFYFEGTEFIAYEGDTIASALIANGIDIFGYTSKKGRPRGLFCCIGKCSSCLVVVNGIPNVRACITPVEEGMKVRRQVGKGVTKEVKEIEE